MNLAGALLAGVERGLVPLDVLRRELYRALAPWLGPWIREREVRIAIHGALVVVGSLLGALVAPLWLLALGPLLLGVPHLLADARYLVARPGLHHRVGAWAVGGLLVASSFAVDLRWGLAATVFVPLLARGSWVRRLAVSGGFATLFIAALVAERSTHVFLAHAHNLVAVVLWMALAVALHEPTRRGHLARWLPTAGFAVGGLAILGGAFDGVMATGFALPGAPSLGYHTSSLAPGLDPVWASRWVVAFAYAQAVHYGLWLRVIPEEGRHRPAPRSWGASLSALRADFGDVFLALTVLVTLGIALWGLADLTAARAGYLRLALFHGPLELVVLGLVAVEGRSVLHA